MIHTLQILRAVAALSVVIYHTSTWGQVYIFPEDPALQHFCNTLGAFGVNLFFLISGFIMYHVTDAGSDPRKFFGRRIIRIVPLYWLMTVFGRGLGFLTNPSSLLSMFFIPLTTEFPPFYGWARWIVGWTLNYEMFFYLLFFLSLYLRRWRFTALFGAYAMLHLVFIHFSGGGILGVVQSASDDSGHRVVLR